MNNFNLVRKIMQNIAEIGYKEWTPVQEKIIPLILANNDILACSQTGTGKTATFALPIINKIYISNIKNNVKPDDERKTQALILAPTRDLSIQIFQNIKSYAKKMNIRSVCLYGGVPKNKQIRRLDEGCEIVVGTPGRILDLIDEGHLDVSNIKFRVLDEIDHMLDIGFYDAITTIISMIKKPDLTLMFSATIPEKIKKLAKQFLKENYKYVEINAPNSVVSTIEQIAILTSPKKFLTMIHEFFQIEKVKSAIIFTKTKNEVDTLKDDLINLGIQVESIHGDKDQWERNRVIREFKEGKVKVLVATNVLARGIDVPNVQYVINYHLPEDIESYIHRVGRTGRASKFGKAVTFLSKGELDNLARIQVLTKDKIIVYKTDDIKNIDKKYEYELANVGTHENYQPKFQKNTKLRWQKNTKFF